MIGGAKLKQEITLANGHQTTDAQACMDSCINLGHIGITHLNIRFKECGHCSVNVNVTTKTPSSFNSNLEERLQIRFYGNTEFKGNT